MKRLFMGFVLTAIIASPVQAEDILSILEWQSKIDRPSPPSTIPYNYTVDFVMSGKEGADAKAPFTAKLLINPAEVPDTRVTILSTSSEDYDDEFKEFLKEMQNPETNAEDLAEDFGVKAVMIISLMMIFRPMVSR